LDSNLLGPVKWALARTLIESKPDTLTYIVIKHQPTMIDCFVIPRQCKDRTPPILRARYDERRAHPLHH
jgi:hypothetical protein